MVDIKELLQTYAVINDPNVKEVTTKFGILLVGLGVAGLAVWGVVGLSEDAATQQAPAAESGDEEAALTGERTQDCVPADQADEWRQENREILLENRLLDTDENGDWVCYTYIA